MSRPGDREWAAALLSRARAEWERVRSTCRTHGGVWSVDREGDGPAFVVDASHPPGSAGVLLAFDRPVADHVARWSPRAVSGVVRGHVEAVSSYLEALDRLARLESAPGFNLPFVEQARAEVGALRWGVVSVIALLYPEEVVDGGTGDASDGAAQREDVDGGGAGVDRGADRGVRAGVEVEDRAGGADGDDRGGRTGRDAVGEVADVRQDRGGGAGGGLDPAPDVSREVSRRPRPGLTHEAAAELIARRYGPAVEALGSGDDFSCPSVVRGELRKLLGTGVDAPSPLG